MKSQNKRVALSTALLLLFLLPTAAIGQETDETESDGTESDETESDEAFLNPDPPAEETEEIAAGEQDKQPTESEDDESVETPKKLIRDHKHQVVINALVGTGFFLVAPWDKNNPEKMCEPSEENPNEGEPFCTGRSGFYLNLQGGFGITKGLEVYAIFRLGLERPGGDLLNQPVTRQIGAGIRVYTPKDGLFKIGFGIAPLFDFSDRGTANLGNDFVIHVPIQAQFDINRWFGTYLQVAPNFSFISEFRVELTGGIGLQGRFI